MIELRSTAPRDAREAHVDRVLREGFWLAPRVAPSREVTDLAAWRARAPR